MKLHLPKALITALTAVYAAAAPLATTVATGAAAVATQASAEGETQTPVLHDVTFDTTMDNGARDNNAERIAKDAASNYLVSGYQYINTPSNSDLTILGLHIGEGAGFRNNSATYGVKVTHLYIDSSIVFGGNPGVGHITQNRSGSAVFTITSTAGAWVDINADYGTNINVHSMNGGKVYLNENGYLNTSSYELAATNAVYAAYSAESGHRVSEDFAVSSDGSQTLIWSTGTGYNRTLLGGDYQNWGGTVDFSGLLEGMSYVVSKTSTGLGVSYGQLSETLSTRNGQAFRTTGVRTALTGSEITDSMFSGCVAVANNKSAWSNSTGTMAGLLLGDGAGIKFNHSNNITVTYLQIGTEITFDNNTGDAAGYIRWSGGERKFVISNTEGAWVDIDSDVGNHIKVDAMCNGSVYLNTNGRIDTTGFTLNASNTVYAKHDAGSAMVEDSTFFVDANGATVLWQAGTGKRRYLLKGDYTGWSGTLHYEGSESLDGFIVNYNATGMSVNYGTASDKKYATRNGETFNTTNVNSSASLLDETSPCVMILATDAGTISSWTSRTNITGLYFEDGAGLKFNHSENVTVTYLQIGKNITFDTNSGNDAGYIRWSGGDRKFVISSTSGAWVDIDSYVGNHVKVDGMTNGTVYLNENGKIDTTNYLLGTSNTIHAVLNTNEDEGNFSFYGFDATGHMIHKGTERILLTGDYSGGWDGTYVFLDADRNALGESAYVTTTTGSGIGVSYLTTDAEVYTGDSNQSTTEHGVLYRENGDITIQGVGALTFNANSATGEQGAGAIYAGGDVTIIREGAVTFSGNHGNKAGAIYAAGADTTVTLAATTADVTFSGNTMGASDEANDIAFANGGTLKLSAKQDRTLTLGGGVKGDDVNVVVNGGDEESGKVVMGGVNEYSGTTTVSDGTLKVTGSISGTSSVKVSGDGVLEISGAGASVASNGITATANGESGTAKNLTIGQKTVADAAVATISGAGDTLQTLGQMSSLTLSFAAENTAAEISNVTMTDSVLSGGAVSLGDNVTAVVSYASTKDTPAQAPASPASLSGIAMLGATGEPETITATAVKSGGSIDGALTVDIDGKLLSAANAGKTLEWTILENMTSVTNFRLKLGGVLQYLLSTGHEMTLSGSLVDDPTVPIQLTMSNIDKIATPSLVAGGLITGTAGSLVLTVENIPEPATGTLAVLALAGLAARRRRK